MRGLIAKYLYYKGNKNFSIRIYHIIDAKLCRIITGAQLIKEHFDKIKKDEIMFALTSLIKKRDGYYCSICDKIVHV